MKKYLLLTVMLCAAVLCSCSGRKYYLFPDGQWIPNSNGRCRYTIATTDKRDIDIHNKGLIGYGGDLTIVSIKKIGGKMTKVISGSDIVARLGLPKGSESDINLTAIPSSIDPDLVYFNCMFNGAAFSRCGKVNCRTGEFMMFLGEIAGMIRHGEYKNCYLRVDDEIPGVRDGVKIFRQTPVGESDGPLVVFRMSDIDPGLNEFDLIRDQSMTDIIIQAIENDALFIREEYDSLDALFDLLLND